MFYLPPTISSVEEWKFCQLVLFVMRLLRQCPMCWWIVILLNHVGFLPQLVLSRIVLLFCFGLKMCLAAVRIRIVSLL